MDDKDLHDIKKLTKEEHIQLAIWAAHCAEDVLSIFETNCDDDRPRKAIEAARSWAKGELKMTEARQFAFAARAAGHAAATAHVASHAKYAAAYALKATNGSEITKQRQLQTLPQHLHQLIYTSADSK